MLKRLLSALPLVLVGASALAASDLTVTITPPTAPAVYQDARYDVVVDNIGNQNAANVTLTIALPTTGSAPTNTVLGVLGARSSNCNLSGANLVCSLGTINKKKSGAVYFRVAFPYASAPMVVTATAATTSGENSYANNSAAHTAALTFYANPIDTSGGPVTVVNTHCTGTGLTSFFICTLFPSSISSHTVLYHDDGTISFDGYEDGYSGVWSQPDETTLVFDYFYEGDLVASFFGRGVPDGCFEGVTTFGDGYNAGYEVCP